MGAFLEYRQKIHTKGDIFANHIFCSDNGVIDLTKWATEVADKYNSPLVGYRKQMYGRHTRPSFTKEKEAANWASRRSIVCVFAKTHGYYNGRFFFDGCIYDMSGPHRG